MSTQTIGIIIGVISIVVYLTAIIVKRRMLKEIEQGEKE